MTSFGVPARPQYVRLDKVLDDLRSVEQRLWARASYESHWLHGLKANHYRCLARDVRKIVAAVEHEAIR